MAEPTSNPKFDGYSKELPWYYKDIDGHLAPISRELLEEYSHIPDEDVNSHVYKIVPPSLFAFPFPFLALPLSPTTSANPTSETPSGPTFPTPALVDSNSST
jgi:hypothetical protein